MNSVEGFLADFLTPILSNIIRELMRESLIKIHQLVSGNTTFVALNLGGVRHVHLALTMNAEDYMAHTGHVFVTPHSPRNYPPTMGTAQEQAI